MSFNFSKDDFNRYVNRQNHLFESVKKNANDSMLFESNENIKLTRGEPEQYTLQKIIRESFGKASDLNMGEIADHPDFKHLVSGGMKKQFITTMFVDIKGSTRLSLKYPNDLEFIYKFKNAVIKTCIEVIHGFDGYVHRIMGDAILGFFGSTEISKAQSILDCLNTAAMLKVVLEQTIKPWLQQEKPSFDPRDFGFRIGCNFGDNEEILWANYGFGHIGEVSPTGLPVDLAAKLQGLAQKNQTMLGQGLLEYFNFPTSFSNIKTVIKNGEKVEKRIITPDYTKADGSNLNYTMRLLNTDKYILGLPLPLNIKAYISMDVKTEEKIIPNENFSLKSELINKDGTIINYISNSKVIEKDNSIKVSLLATNIRLGDHYKVRFIKQNNSGFNDEPELKECLDQEIIEDALEEKPIYHKLNWFQKSCFFKRDCKYKGLHYIKCEVLKNEEIIFRDYVYVPIE